MNFPFHSFDPVYKAQAVLEILNLNFRLSVGPFHCRRAGDLLWSVASLEYNFIVAPRHIEQEELEAVLVHVLGLVFVLAQPGKSEFTDRSPNALKKRSVCRQGWVARLFTPSIGMASHVELVAHVLHLWRGYLGSSF